MKYVNIPYKLKDEFKKRMEVKWDKEVKSWYINDYYNSSELSAILDEIDKIAKKSNIPFDKTNFFNASINKPVIMPEGAKTIFQWAREDKFPKDLSGGIMASRLKDDGSVSLDENGDFRAYLYFKPEEVRDLTKEDEDYLFSHYKSYKTHFDKDGNKIDKNNKKATTPKEETKEKAAEKSSSKTKEKEEEMEVTLNKSWFKELCRREIINNPNPIFPFDEKDPANKLICLDVETTGFNPKKDEMLQISIFNGDGKPLFSSFIKPYIKTSWTGAMIVNHISPKMVANSCYAHEFAPIINKIVENADKILGYNTEFDTGFIEETFAVSTEGKEILDPYKNFKGIETPSGKHALRDALLYYCNESVVEEYDKNKHRSDTDALATLKLYNAIENKEKDEIDIER